MAEMTKIIEIVKRAALDAVNAQKPVNICYGRVTKDDPIEIALDQKLILGVRQLVFTRPLRGSCEVGDELLLLRQQGGQKYVVVSKL